MARENYSDLLALIAVARERSFTRAAVELGMSQSMLSLTIRKMEERLGVRLLTRTTRSVSVTEAGQKLLAVVTPNLKEIEAELRTVAEARDAPVGTLRIAATDHAIDTVLWPKLEKALAAYPQLTVEMHVDYGVNDIVKGRYDFGIRQGNEVSKDTSAIRIGADQRYAIVGSPQYLASRVAPASPEDLVGHECIGLRLATAGSLQAWELKRGSRVMQARINGRLVFNGVRQVLNATLSGFGLSYVPEDLAEPYLESGALMPVLKPWWRKFPGYHLIHASVIPTSRAMQIVIDALKHRS